MIKVIANAKAWYKNTLIEIGDKIDYEGETLPSWADPVEPIKQKAPAAPKVSELDPEVKTAMIAKAKLLAIPGNHEVFLVSTLEQKIAEAEAKAETEAKEKEKEKADAEVKFEALKAEAKAIGVEVLEDDTFETLLAKVDAEKNKNSGGVQ